jgi:hypothetical protein
MVPVPTFEKVMIPVPVPTLEVPVPVPVPVPALYVDHKMLIFQEYFWIFFLHSKLFYKEKVQKFQQIYCKM